MSIPRVSDKTIDMEKSSSSTNLLKGEDGQRNVSNQYWRRYDFISYDK